MNFFKKDFLTVLLVAMCVLTGCSRTGVQVVISATDRVTDAATRVTVELVAADGASESRSFGEAETDDALLQFPRPIRFAIQPKDGDASRTFSLVATAFDSSGEAIAIARRRGAFVSGTVLLVSLELSEICNPRCGPTETCENTVCVLAPPIVMDAGVPDSGTDLAVADGMTDTASDGSVDSIDAPMDVSADMDAAMGCRTNRLRVGTMGPLLTRPGTPVLFSQIGSDRIFYAGVTIAGELTVGVRNFDLSNPATDSPFGITNPVRYALSKKRQDAAYVVALKPGPNSPQPDFARYNNNLTKNFGASLSGQMFAVAGDYAFSGSPLVARQASDSDSIALMQENDTPFEVDEIYDAFRIDDGRFTLVVRDGSDDGVFITCQLSSRKCIRNTPLNNCASLAIRDFAYDTSTQRIIGLYSCDDVSQVTSFSSVGDPGQTKSVHFDYAASKDDGTVGLVSDAELIVVDATNLNVFSPTRRLCMDDIDGTPNGLGGIPAANSLVLSVDNERLLRVEYLP